MTTNEKIRFILAVATDNRLFSFTYTKENGEKSRRTIRCHIDVAARMEKQGTPINGQGNWHTGMTTGPRSIFIDKGNGIEYVRGIDMADSKFKIFKLDGMTDFA